MDTDRANPWSAAYPGDARQVAEHSRANPEATSAGGRFSRFVVVIDNQEKAPYSFTGMRCDSKDGGGLLTVRTTWAHLPTGDYSILGYEDLVCVERKSLADLYSTLGSNRERFEREHQRMAEMVARGGAAAVFIEADWPTILASPPPQSRLNPKTVQRTSLAWWLRYRVPWMPIGDRRLTELWTYRFLERFDLERRKQTQAKG